MRHHPRFVAGLIALGLLTSDLALLHAQTSADLFDDRILQDVRILINSKDLKLLHERYNENTYYPADIIWKNVRVRNIAVRSRGLGSRNPYKLGLRFDFDYYATGQRFLGLRGLILKNLWQDPGFIREPVTMAFFQRMGEAASRESFARFYINNVYQGVYALVEEPDLDYLSRTIGENSGYLFEYHWQFPWYGEYLGDNLAAYGAGKQPLPLFEPRTHEKDADTLIWGPIRDLVREINQAEDAVWRDRVEQLIDLQEFVRHAAIEEFVGENDGLLGYAGMNNFYFYRFAGTNRHRMFVWDKDNAFIFLGASIFRNGDQNVLFRRAMTYSDLKTLFLDTLEKCAQKATEDNWMLDTINRYAALIDASVREDKLKQFTNDEFDSQLGFLRDFAQQQPGFVLSDVAKNR